MNHEFVCLECKHALDTAPQGYICPQCGTVFPARSGIPVFLKPRVDYWCEIPRENMPAVLEHAREQGWQSAVREKVKPEVQGVILDKNRADWKYVVALNADSTVLDIGSGWGGLAFSLASSVRRVYAYEPVEERACFVAIRAAQDRVDNLKVVCGNAVRLPFADAFFDCVVLNGVLEWVGGADTCYSPDENQKRVLREALRVLKPGGQLYLAIENRFGFIYFFGAKDPHSGLPFATIMPRWMADGVSRMKRKIPYTTYLYSYSGYRRLLKDAGFGQIDFYTPLPSYRNFRHLVPLSDTRKIRFWFSQTIAKRIPLIKGGRRWFFLLVAMLLKTPCALMFKLFTPDYSIVASSNRAAVPACAAITGGHDNACSLVYQKSWRKKLIFVFAPRGSRPVYFWRIADDEIGRRRLEAEVRIITELGARDERFKPILPRIIKQVMLGNEYAVLEHYESGTPMDRIFSGWHINDALPRRIAGQVTDLLVLLANITAGEGCRKPDFRARVMEVAQLAVAKPEFSETERDRLIRMVDEGLAAEPEVVFRYVLQHRDFRPENMVYSLRPRSMVVFDWEYARQDGVPLVDLFYFLFRCAAWHKQKPVRLKKFFPAGDIFQRGMDVNILDHVFYKRNSCSQIAAEQVSRYCRQVGVTRNCAQLLFLQFVAKHLDFNPEFLKRFLNDSQPLFLRGLCEKR